MRWSLLVLALVGGCSSSDRYAIEQSSGGTLVRLDKRSGTIMMLRDGALFELRENDPTSSTDTTTHWPEQHVPTATDSTLSVALTTKWRDGHLYYLLRVEPAAVLKQIAKDSPLRIALITFTANLLDSDGFLLGALKVPLTDLSLVVDSEGQPVAFQGQGITPMSRDTYYTIQMWSIAWQL